MLMYEDSSKWQRFTSCFNVKFRVQSHMARLHHLDALCTATQYQYLKQFVVLNWNETRMVCMDDKAVVPVGKPCYAPVHWCKTTTTEYSLQQKALNLWQWTKTLASMVLSHIFKIPSIPLFAQWNYKKKFPLVPFYKIKNPKITFFLLLLKTKALACMSFENFRSKDLTINLMSPNTVMVHLILSWFFPFAQWWITHHTVLGGSELHGMCM